MRDIPATGPGLEHETMSRIPAFSSVLAKLACQRILPRPAWPAAGSTPGMGCQYLDGLCANDGNARPRRIERFPLDTPATGGRP